MANVAPLPQRWTEAVDPHGRRYYVDHMARTTQWQYPVPEVSGLRLQPTAPPPYPSTPTTTTQQHQPPVEGTPCVCTPRITFWIGDAVSFVVWVFGVTASADDHWLEGVHFSVGDEDILEGCENHTMDNGFCNRYLAFNAAQRVGSMLVSVSMVVLMVATFRPGARGCCKTRHLGIAGGCLMVLYAICQIYAFGLVVAIERVDDNKGDVFNGDDLDLGATFAVAVIASVLAVVDAVVILVFQKYAGDGPFYACIRACLAMRDTDVFEPPHARSACSQEQDQQQYPQTYLSAVFPPRHTREPTAPPIS